MENISLIIKGFGFALLAWIGVQVATSHPDHMILTIKYNSIGYYLLFIMPMISLVWGGSMIRRYIIRKLRQFQEKHEQEIKRKCDA